MDQKILPLSTPAQRGPKPITNVSQGKFYIWLSRYFQEIVNFVFFPVMPFSNGSIQRDASGIAVAQNSLQPGTSMSNPNQDLAQLFECPVCFDYVLPPILQCQSGHLVCSTCRPKLQCCPTCRGPLGSIRNLAMEKVANTVMFPCKYNGVGCSVTLLHTEKSDHEETCEYRPYSCPCPGASCKWQGSLDQVMPHLTQAHKSITTLQGWFFLKI